MVRQVLTASFFVIALTLLQADLTPQKSTTGNSVPYREVFRTAASNESIFQNFRSIEA